MTSPEPEEYYPNKQPQCKWYPGIDMTACPHYRRDWSKKTKILSNVLEAVGNTPLIKLNCLPARFGVKCDVFAKCECFNPGGSVKDRIAIQMVEQAEKNNQLQPYGAIIVPTTGNNGIGMAMVAAVKGYTCIVVMSEKMSEEKQAVINALGALCCKVPEVADAFSPYGIFAVAYKLKHEIRGSWVANQYLDSANTMAHYDGTALELLEQCHYKIDMLVGSVESAGTLTGVGRRFKEVIPKCKIIAADPMGSKIYPETPCPDSDVDWEVEGMGLDFKPATCAYHVIDEFIKVYDPEAHVIARKLILEEGILCGPSGGAAIAVGLMAAKNLKKGQRCVVIIPETVRNYITKFIDDRWMEGRLYQPCYNIRYASWWVKHMRSVPLPPCSTVLDSDTIKVAYDLVTEKPDLEAVAVLDKSGAIIGTIEKKTLLRKLINRDINECDPVCVILQTSYPRAMDNFSLGLVSRILEREDYCVICTQACPDVIAPLAIARPKDVLDFILSLRDPYDITIF